MLEVVVFICGAVVMVLEMTGSRVLAPFLGTSIVVWTSLIGIILGSLSLGYWWGGRLADNNPRYKTLGDIVLVAACFIAAIALTKSFVLSFLQTHAGSIHLGATAATMILFAPSSVLLGMVSPYAVRLKMKNLEQSGRTVGNLYAISTIGSIVGTFAAGFFLIGFFGSTNIIIILSIVLALTSLIAYKGDWLLKGSVAALFVLALILSASYEDYLDSLDFHDIDTQYSRLLVYNTISMRTGKPMRVLVTGPEGTQSGMYLDDHIELALRYSDFYRLAPYFKPGMKKVLMLGGGGYSFPKYALRAYPEMQMDVVEIDPGVTAAARKFFALKDDPRLKIHHEDARMFLNKARQPYDVILCDTFNSHYSVPFHLSTVECVGRMHDLLVDDGVVVVNILSAMEGDKGRFLRAECATFKAVFPQVYLFPVNSSGGTYWQNVILVALKSDRKPEFRSEDPSFDELLQHLRTEPIERDLPILTDDYAPVDRYVAVLN